MKNDVQFDTLVATAPGWIDRESGWIDRESDGLGAPLRPTTSFLRDRVHALQAFHMCIATAGRRQRIKESP
jgi:hypothetical protein